MSFPLFSGKHALPAMIDPQDIVAYRAQLGRAPKVTELQGVLLCVERGPAAPLAPQDSHPDGGAHERGAVWREANSEYGSCDG